MKKLLTIALLLAVAASASALDRSPRKKKRDKKAKTETVVPAPVPEAEPVPVPEPEPAPAEEPVVNDMTLGFSPEQTDSLLAAWRERQRQDAFSEFFKQYILEDSTEVADSTPDSVYSRRLLDLASPIQFPYNSIVKGYINRYTNSRYGTISRILGMSQYYFPIIEEELLREGLPVELRALPIIESALSPTAVSPMGAVGLWQFMPTTGKSYGLEINSLVDERRDPYRATQAACRYLKDLFAIYNDWSLAIAAYNCGPGNVNKAIGASYAYAYHRQHGIEPTEAPIPLSVDTVRINKLMHLEQISSTIDLPIETLRQLNPQYKLDIIPATTKPYTLVLPQRYVMQYIAHEPEIQAKDSMYLKEYINPANIDKKRQERSGSVYVVKKGDTLGAIARRYRVTTAQIMRWNKLKSAHKLRIGQRLRIEGR